MCSTTILPFKTFKNIKDTGVRTYPELEHYPTAEEGDIYLPIAVGINPNDDYEYVPGNVEVISDDGHHKHICCKGLPTEALLAMNEIDSK